MRGNPKYLLIMAFLGLVTGSMAQNTQVMYHLDLPQNHLLNPALVSSNPVYVGLPAISGISMNLDNNFVKFSDVFFKVSGSDSVYSILSPGYDAAAFLLKLKNKTFFEPDATVQTLGVGFTAGKDWYFFLDINERVEGSAYIPKELFDLALQGNEQFVGKTIDLSSLTSEAMYYRELGLGFSKNITDRLRIGVKGKMLFGLASAVVENNTLTVRVNDESSNVIETAPDQNSGSYSHVLDADMLVRVSGPVRFYLNEEQGLDSVVVDKDDPGFDKIILGTGNPGMGLDIGATYRASDRLMLSAAVTNLGFIRWNRNDTTLGIKTHFEYSGLDITDYLNGSATLGEIGEQMADSLKNSVHFTKSHSPFTTWLPAGINLGGSYSFTNYFSLGILSYTRFINNHVREQLTLSANINLSNRFSSVLGYTLANSRYDNLGAGIVFRASIFQLYAFADRIPLTLNRIKVNENGSFPVADVWNQIHFRLGLNLVFGNGQKDKPMLNVE